MVDLEGELTQRVSRMVGDLVVELLQVEDPEDRRVLALAAVSTLREAILDVLEGEEEL